MDMEQREHNDEFSADHLPTVRLPRRLFERIMNRIGIERKLAASRRKTTYFSLAFVGSIAALSVMFLALRGAVIASELPQALSLIFSDPQTVAQNWQDFSLFFLESLPVLYLAAFLVALFALLESLKYSVKYLEDLFTFSKLVKNN